jgi:hypothetical protein
VAENPGEEDEGTDISAGGVDEDQRRSWGDYAAGVSGVVVLVGALIYTLGLFALWAPIARTHTHDLITAWHETFLVPRAVVAGLGVKQLVAFPLLAGIIIFAIVFYSAKLSAKLGSAWGLGRYIRIFPIYALVLVYCTWRIATTTSPISQTPFVSIFLFVSGVVFVFVSLGALIYQRTESGYWDRHSIRWGLAVLVAVFVALAQWLGLVSVQPSLGRLSGAIGSLTDVALIVGAGTIVYVVAAIYAPLLLEEESSAPDSGLWGMLKPFLLVLSFAFVAAFMLTIPSRPPLPMVEIDIKNTDKDTVGTLLTHTEGFWYVFERHKDQPESRLTAIPDDKVKTAWLSRRAE